MKINLNKNFSFKFFVCMISMTILSEVKESKAFNGLQPNVTN